MGYNGTMKMTENEIKTSLISEEERFMFDLCGFIVIKNALTEEEVDEMNAALDHHLQERHLAGRPAQPHASMATNAPGMFGQSNVYVKIAKCLNDLRADAGSMQTNPRELSEQFKGAGFPPQDAERDAKGRTKLADAEALRAALDTITPGGQMLTPEEKSAAMTAAEPGADGSVRIGVGRTDVSGMLSWPRPWCEPFRRALVNPMVRPYLLTVLGSGYRMDHMPHFMLSDKGTDGHSLHGGGADRYSKGGMLESYSYADGKLYAGMVVVEFMLADEGPGDGGAAVVQGSHKTNLPTPRSICALDKYAYAVTEVNAKKGDAIIFCEACIHGALPWNADHQRRALLYRFNPGHAAYTPGVAEFTYPDWVEDMTEEEKKVVLQPGFPSSMRVARQADIGKSRL